ncbi:hypothetical protein SAY87_023135 [Trapa incisa]|uniref:Nuclear pore complex protein NUP88 n=1 Tax=Trapa incisa TaxID=236973 RepID=A0AAN7K7N3_9MYRT|nr:hypothetical protein SAY87_023135 [Trapa incisa]
MDPPACFSGITAGSAFIAIRLGEPDPASIVAASPSMELQADVRINFMVKNISINRNGSALCVTGADDLCVMYLYGQSSSKDKTLVCRYANFGMSCNLSYITLFEIGVSQISSNAFKFYTLFEKLFDLSVDLMQPEQEFYLQPVEPGRSKNATSLCPVDFTFGGDHLWDRLTVFILFSDGSIYIIFPVVPFGRLKSVNPITIRNSNLAISWFESTFPELSDEVERGKLAFIRACHNALFDASLSLQAPSNLRSVTSNSIEGRSILHKYLNLFLEHYVENAHKVHFELKHHSPHLNRIIDDQHAGLGEVHQWLLKVEEKQKGLHRRIDHITMQHENLEQLLQCLRNLQCAHKGPLSRAERELKAEIDQFGRVELDALHSSIEALLVRSRRYMQSVEEEQTPMRKKPVQDAQISLLKSSIEKLSFVNSENVKKVKLVDSAIKNRGSGG